MKLEFHCGGCVPEAVGLANIAHTRTLGLPFPKRGSSKWLAVVGGAHSVDVEAIRAWKGDKWIIGSAFQWARSHGVSGTFFSAVPTDDVIAQSAGAAHAILATSASPRALSEMTCYVEVFDVDNNGATTATTAPYLAAQMGYEQVHFYGCDSSFLGTTHKYLDDSSRESRMLKKHSMVVRCNGDEFVTCPEFYMQAVFLSGLMRQAPQVFVNRSGGLLAAMVSDQDYDVIAGTADLHRSLGLEIRDERIAAHG